MTIEKLTDEDILQADAPALVRREQELEDGLRASNRDGCAEIEEHERTRGRAERAESEAAALRAAHEQALNERDQAHDALEAQRKAKVEWERLRNEAYARYRNEAEKRERAESEAAALRAELQKERDRRVEHRQMNQSLNEQIQRAESEARASAESALRWRAEVERLRGAVDSANRIGEQYQEMFRAEQKQLAAANALLERWSNFDFDCPEEEYDDDSDCYEQDGSALEKLYADTRAHLSGQAPARRDCSCRDELNDKPCPQHGQLFSPTDSEADALGLPRMAPARSDHERAVLEAWEALGELTSYVVDGHHMVRVDDVRGVMQRAAELARRGAEKR